MVKAYLHQFDGEREGEDVPLDELFSEMAKFDGGWIDLFQPTADEVRPFLDDEMNFHHLAVDDCFEEPVSRGYVYDDHKFLAFKARDADRELDTEHLRAFLKDGWLVTVRHAHMPGIREFRKRFHSSKIKRRGDMGSEYLLYELLDSVADDWYKKLDIYSERLDELEDQVFDPHTKYPNLLESLHKLKGKLREVAKSTTPLDEVVQMMHRSGSDFITPETEVYYRDLADLTHSLVSRIENYNAGAASTRDTYISQSSMRLAQSQAEAGEVMRLLTIIATIMLPITAIASIFGMNIDAFDAGTGPDLNIILAIMGFIGVGMLIWLYSKGWIGKR